MLQTIYFIPNEIGGIPLFGFGLLLALCAIACVVTVAWLAWRQGFNADTLGYIPLFAVLGAIVWFILPHVCEPEGLPIRGYGTMLLFAVLASIGLTVWRGRRQGLDPDMLIMLCFWMILPGILGARIFYIIQYREDFDTLESLLNFTKGGTCRLRLRDRRHCRTTHLRGAQQAAPFGDLRSDGPELHAWLGSRPPGVLPERVLLWRRLRPAVGGGVPRRKPGPYPPGRARPGLSAWPATRRLAAQPAGNHGSRTGVGGRAARIAQGQSHRGRQRRAGSLLSRSRASHVPAEEAGERDLDQNCEGQTFRWAVGVHVHQPIHPTQIYSFINALIVCLLLLAHAPFRTRDGQVFALFLTVYPITRFLLEMIRNDESAIFGTGLTISQNVSLALLACGGILWIVLSMRPRGTAFPKYHPTPESG